MKKSVVYILVAVILSFGIRFLLHEGIRKNEKGVFDKFNTVFLRKNNYNTIFIGSSRSETHFDCRIFDSVNHTNSYNIGMEGATVPFVFTVLKSYLENSAVPQTVVLSIDHVFRFEDADTVYNYPRYFPYLGNRALYEGLKQRDKRFFWFKNVPMYSMPYMGNKYVSASIRGFLHQTSSADKNYNSGFSALPNEKKNPLPVPEIITVTQNNYVTAALDSIIALCRQKNIRLEVVITPVYTRASAAALGAEQHVLDLERYCLKNSLGFYDYHKNAICSDSTLFFDNFHLNQKGAAKFSGIFSSDFHNKAR